MPHILARLFVALVATAVALLLATVVVSGFHMGAVGFPVAVVVLSLLLAILPGVARSGLRRWAGPFQAGASLVGTLVGLILINVLLDSVRIDGVRALLEGTAIVWLASMVALWIGRRKIRRNRRR